MDAMEADFKPFPVKVHIHSDDDPHSAGQKSDKAWFRRYPKRRNRVRWADMVEAAKVEDICPDGMRAAVVVRQITPGGRMRFVLFWTGKLPVAEKDAADLYEWCVMMRSTRQNGPYYFRGTAQ